jgi:tRNA(Ile)-lysidine synthase
VTPIGADPGALPGKVIRALDAHLPPSAAGPLVVAVSGGRDSLVLLHLLRFGRGGEPLLPNRGLVAAHVDHRMRPGSGRDAAWLEGMCRAWRVPCVVVRLAPPPTSEAAARAGRYAALAEVTERAGSQAVLVAHHAEDQAETVLFRLLRGTGPRGLAGMPACRRLGGTEPGTWLLRPLLGVDGAELAEWARAHALRPREDPTNRDLRIARNRIRHEVLPALESGAPGTRDLLLTLAAEARGREVALERILEEALSRVIRGDPGGPELVVARDPLLAYPDPLLAELVRRVVRRGGGEISRGGVDLALRFLRHAGSGRGVTPASGLRIVRDFDRFRFRLGPEPTIATEVDGPRELGIRFGSEGGEGWVVTRPGSAWRVRWGEGEAGGDAGWRAAFPLDLLRFPLTVRGRRSGDRVRIDLRPGAVPRRRSLKKLLTERRVSRDAREAVPLLVDAEGLVIWIPGAWRSRGAIPGDGMRTWTIGVRDARDDEHERA